jgi:hypothetical protein
MEDTQDQVVVERIKVGEDEYTQDELTQLVDLGKIGREAEEKFGTKIDRVWPEYTKKSQYAKELESKVQDYETRLSQSASQKQSQGEELSPDEARRVARQQAKELGLVTTEDFDQYYMNRRAAERLIDDSESTIQKMTADGFPKTTVDQLLRHMDETGIRQPGKAYKDMFETEIDEIKEKKYVGLTKKSSLVTGERSFAGSKSPMPTKVTDDNIGQLLAEAFASE